MEMKYGNLNHFTIKLIDVIAGINQKQCLCTEKSGVDFQLECVSIETKDLRRPTQILSTILYTK